LGVLPEPQHTLAVSTEEKTLKAQAELYPETKLFHEGYRVLQSMKLIEVRLDGDVRSRCGLRAFATKTSRCAPSSKEFIFGPGRWIRHFIIPGAGHALAYIDLEQAEFGIAAALSGDPAMLEAYLSSDCYLTFARQAGKNVPIGATEKTHPHLTAIRAIYKIVVLATQYGRTAYGLAQTIGDLGRGRARAARRTSESLPVFWVWIEDQVDSARLNRFIMFIAMNRSKAIKEERNA